MRTQRRQAAACGPPPCRCILQIQASGRGPYHTARRPSSIPTTHSRQHIISIARSLQELASSRVSGRRRAMSSKNDKGVGGAVAVAALAVGAVISYFLWPLAAPVAAVVMMKAPGAGGLLISRAAFVANPQLYYSLLRTAGAAVAAAAFAA